MLDDVKTVIREAAEFSLDRLSAPRSPIVDERAPIVISVLKNERRRVDEFLEHYRALGVERFVLIDNGSTDGTTQRLAAQRDVDLLGARRSFVWQRKQGWIARAIEAYGHERWYVYVDADELLTFDGAPKRRLPDLAAFADRLGITRVRGVLIDMYGDGPLLRDMRDDGASLGDMFPFFDAEPFDENKFRELISRKGGPRKRAFGRGRADFNPEMTKYPLFKPSSGELMTNPHHIYPYGPNFLSDCYIGLLHYKFLPGFATRIRTAIAEKTYWNNSSEYRVYLDVLGANEAMSLKYEGSRRYATPLELINAGLIAEIAWDDRPRRDASAVERGES